MTERKNRALQVPPVVPYKALGNFPKDLYGATAGTWSARFFFPSCHVTCKSKKIVSIDLIFTLKTRITFLKSKKNETTKQQQKQQKVKLRLLLYL